MVPVRGNYVAVACFERIPHSGLPTASTLGCEAAVPTGNRPIVVECLSMVDRRRWLEWASMVDS